MSAGWGEPCLEHDYSKMVPQVVSTYLPHTVGGAPHRPVVFTETQVRWWQVQGRKKYGLSERKRARNLERKNVRGVEGIEGQTFTKLWCPDTFHRTEHKVDSWVKGLQYIPQLGGKKYCVKKYKKLNCFDA